MNRRSLRGSLRPLPGAVSTPVETSTPQGRTRRIASATLSGVSPPASSRRTPSNAPLTWHQSNTRPEPGLGASRSTTSAGPSEAIEIAGSPAAKPWTTSGTRCRTYTTSAVDSRPWSCAPLSPTLLTISTTRSGRSSRKTPSVSTSSYGTCFTMSVASSTVTMRGLPEAKTNPSASAPSAIARSASFSVVMPQILTNIARHRSVGSLRWPSIGTAPDPAVGGRWTARLGVDEPAVQVVVVRREVEEPVAAEVEQDHALLIRLLRGERLVDDGPDGVPGLGSRDLALGVGELDRRFERLALGVGDRLHAAAPHQARHDRRVAVVAKPAGMDRGRHELVAERVHREQRRHACGVTEVVVERAFGERRARRRLGGDEPHVLVGDERKRDAAQVRAAAAAADDDVRPRVAGPSELLLRFQPDYRLVQQHVVEHRPE